MATDAEQMLLDRTLTYLRAGGDASRLTQRQRQMIDDLGGPTPERISKANGSLQTHRLHRKNSRAAKEIAFRVGLPALRLYQQGQIGTAELRAANKFHADVVAASGSLASSLVSKYGQNFHWSRGNTPISQQADTARLNRVERQAYHCSRYAGAARILGNRATWLSHLICGVPLPGQDNVPTLQDLGHHLGETDPEIAKSAAAGMVVEALGELAGYYEAIAEREAAHG